MTNQRRFFQRLRLWSLLCGLTLTVAHFCTPLGVGTAQAATTNCNPNGATQNCTITYTYTGAPETWTAPVGVTQATFDLVGAQGGGSGGYGGRVVATLTVTPGAIYQIRVGGTNGYNGGGITFFQGFDGGGASDVSTGSSQADRLLVAGGGGGSGLVIDSLGALYHTRGGNVGYGNSNASHQRGADGENNPHTDLTGKPLQLFIEKLSIPTEGGKGSGMGGGLYAENGSLGQGGKGAYINVGRENGFGGGGGGGYYGGGGGGVGSGGGGGSSYGPSNAIFYAGSEAFNKAVVVITYSNAIP